MKRILLSVLVFFIIVNLASANQAEDKIYTVKKGDSIYKIATKVFHIPWGKVKTEARERNLIFPNQKILLSDLLDINVKSIWEDFNRNPFKRFPVNSEKQLFRDIQGLRILGLTREQTEEITLIHIKALEKSQEGFRWDVIGKGDRFSKMLFGEFYLLRNVVVAWKGKKQAARVYTLSNGIEVWYPINCGNWAMKEKKVFALRPPPVPPIPPPPPIIGRIQGILLAHYQKYRWDWDSTWGGFDERYRDGNHVRGWWQSSTLYPILFEDFDGNQWAFGLNYTTRDWSGETGESNPFHYKGSSKIWSLAGRFRDQKRDWEVLGRAGLGQRKDEGYLNNEFGQYSMEQETDIINFYSSAEYNGRADEKWFSKIRVSGEVEVDMNHQKNDYWTDEWDGQQPLNGSPDPKDSYNLAIYTDIVNFNKDFQIWGEGRETYYAENSKLGTGIRIGPSFLNGSIKIGVGYTDWQSSQGNTSSTGFYGEISFYNLYHRFFDQGKLKRNIPLSVIEQMQIDEIDTEKAEQEIWDILKQKPKEKGGV